MADFFSEIGHLFFVSFFEQSPFGIKTRNISKLTVLRLIRWSLLLRMNIPSLCSLSPPSYIVQRYQIDQAGNADASDSCRPPFFSWRAWERWQLSPVAATRDCCAATWSLTVLLISCYTGAHKKAPV